MHTVVLNSGALLNDPTDKCSYVNFVGPGILCHIIKQDILCIIVADLGGVRVRDEKKISILIQDPGKTSQIIFLRANEQIIELKNLNSFMEMGIQDLGSF